MTFDFDKLSAEDSEELEWIKVEGLGKMEIGCKRLSPSTMDRYALAASKRPNHTQAKWLNETLLDAIVVDWRHVVHSDGKPVECTRANKIRFDAASHIFRNAWREFLSTFDSREATSFESAGN